MHALKRFRIGRGELTCRRHARLLQVPFVTSRLRHVCAVFVRSSKCSSFVPLSIAGIDILMHSFSEMLKCLRDVRLCFRFVLNMTCLAFAWYLERLQNNGNAYSHALFIPSAPVTAFSDQVRDFKKFPTDEAYETKQHASFHVIHPFQYPAVFGILSPSVVDHVAISFVVPLHSALSAVDLQRCVSVSNKK